MQSEFKIAYYLPSKTVTNEDLVREFGGWTAKEIEKNTGICQRHCAADREIASDCAVKAAQQLFQKYDTDKSSIDFLIFVTQSQDYSAPTTACLIQNRLGLSSHIGAFDINLGCTGFMYALSVVKGLLATNTFKNILILTSETLTKYIHPKDKSAKAIFGDAGAAILVSNKCTIGNFEYGTDGSGGEMMIRQNGAFRFPFTQVRGLDYEDQYGNTLNDDYFKMKGTNVFLFTLKTVPSLIQNILNKNNQSLQDIDLFIFHQANGFLLEHLRKKIGIPPEKFFVYLKNVGNTVSSTIPIALKEAMRQQKIKKGSKVLLAAFGVGLSWGGTIIEI